MSEREAEVKAALDDIELMICELSYNLDSSRAETAAQKSEIKNMKIDYDQRLEYLESNPFNKKE